MQDFSHPKFCEGQCLKHSMILDVVSLKMYVPSPRNLEGILFDN